MADFRRAGHIYIHCNLSSCSISIAHLAAREGHLMCLKYLLCTHGNILEAIYNKNNMVIYNYKGVLRTPCLYCRCHSIHTHTTYDIEDNITITIFWYLKISSVSIIMALNIAYSR